VGTLASKPSLPGFASLGLAHHAVPLHQLDHPGGPVIPDPESSLEKRCRGFSGFDDEACRLIVERVVHVADIWKAGVFPFRSLEDFIPVIRLGLTSEKTRDLLDLLLGDQTPVKANGAGGTRRQKEHVTLAQQLFGAVGVQYSPRVYFRRNTERDPGREVCFDQTGYCPDYSMHVCYIK